MVHLELKIVHDDDGEFVNSVGHAVTLDTPLTLIEPRDRTEYERSILPLLRRDRKDSSAPERFSQFMHDHFLIEYFHASRFQERLRTMNWHPEEKLFRADATAFAFPDGSGIEACFNFWPRERGIIVHSQLELNVNSQRTDEVPKSGDPTNRVLFHALELQYPHFATGEFHPRVFVPFLGSFDLSFAPLDRFVQLRDDMVNWYETIGPQKLQRLVLMVDMINGLYDAAHGGSHAVPEGFSAAYQHDTKELALELAALPIERLRDQFMKELLQAMRKSGPLPRGAYHAQQRERNR